MNAKRSITDAEHELRLAATARECVYIVCGLDVSAPASRLVQAINNSSADMRPLVDEKLRELQASVATAVSHVRFVVPRARADHVPTATCPH
jgi:hypothetical protein